MLVVAGSPDLSHDQPAPEAAELQTTTRRAMRRRAAFGRQARKAVGWALGVFVAVQLASGLVLDYAAPLLKFPSARAVLRVARENPHRPEFAFFGSSRTGAAVHHADLDREIHVPGKPWPRTVSMAVPAADGTTMEFLLDQWLETGPVPQWAVVEVSPETVNTHNTWWMPLHVLRQLNWEHVPTHSWAAVKGNAAWPYLESRLVPTYTYRKQIVAEAKNAVRERLHPTAPALPPDPTVVRADPSPVPLNWTEIIKPKPRASDEQLMENSRLGAQTTIRKSLTPYRVGGLTAAALERMLGRCREAGIKVILLGIPTCSPHRAAYTPEIEAAYDGYIRTLMAGYDCLYVDGRAWVPDTLFLDTLHVDVEGGKLFTRRLAREVLKDLPLE